MDFSLKLDKRIVAIVASLLFGVMVPLAFAQQGRQAEIGFTETLLPDGTLLVVGGMDGGKPTDAVWLLNPATGKKALLTQGLRHARAHHAALLLPSGEVLVHGGISRSGSIVHTPELFDPVSKVSRAASPEMELEARAHHKLVILSDGSILNIGGISARDTASTAIEVLDAKTKTVASLSASEHVSALNLKAELLVDGRILFYGGADVTGGVQASGWLFEPNQRTVEQATETDIAQLLAANRDARPFQIIETLPASDARDVSLDQIIALRFSRPLSLPTVTSGSLVFMGPTGVADARWAPAFDGRLLFVVPKKELLPDSEYTVFVDDVADTTGEKVDFDTITFRTRALSTISETGELGAPGGSPSAPTSRPDAVPGHGLAGLTELEMSAADDEVFVPGPQHRNGRWRSERALPELVRLLRDRDERFRHRIAAQLARIAPGTAKTASATRSTGEVVGTGVSGVVLRLNDAPLAGVTVSVGASTSITDAEGRFTITNVSPGRHEIVVNGETAARQGKQYAQVVFGVDVKEGVVAEIPHPIYLPRIRSRDWVNISAPARADTVLTHPDMPELEIHIPRGTVLRDREGRILTRFAIVPVPLDRPPFPVAENFPVYFTIHPGGARVEGLDARRSPGIRVVYPNYNNDPPGTVQNFWAYDSRERGWFVYGNARVSNDGRKVEPNEGVALYETMAISYRIGGGPKPPEPPPPPENCESHAGDPVECSTGLFLHQRNDVLINDTVPIRLTRTYRPGDTVVRPFGVGTTHYYEMYLVGSVTEPILILPDGSRVTFTEGPNGSFNALSTPGRFFGAILNLGSPITVTLRDGSRLLFEKNGSNALMGIVDRTGNRLNITRSGGHIDRISTGSGRYIDLFYDSSNRITSVRDIAGRVWQYSYDSAGLLSRATYPDLSFEQYTYDSAGRMLTVRDRRGNVMVTNVYDANGRVEQQTLADGGVYRFAYTLDTAGKVTQTDVTDPRNFIRRIEFNAAGLIARQTFAFGTPVQQVTVYERDPVTNLLMAQVDPMGRRTEFTYDAKGNMLTKTRLAGTPNAITERYSYEPRQSRMTSYTDAEGRRIEFSYDERGNLIELRDALGNAERFTYSPQGLLLSSVTATGAVTQFEYDINDLARVTDSLGGITERYTGVLGWLLSVKNQMGHRTDYTYDAMGRVIQEKDPLGFETSQAYDSNGNLVGVTDANGGQTQFLYDAKNRLIQRIDPLGRTEHFTHDGNDNVTERIDRKGQRTVLTYDALNRQTQATRGSGAPPSFTETSRTDFVYDDGSRLIEVTDSVSGRITLAYDNLDRLVSETTPEGSVTYAYNAAGQRTALTMQGRPVIAYAYDGAGRLQSITEQGGGVNFTYDAAGRRTTMTLPNGVVATYTYDAASQLTGIVYTHGSVLVGDIVYTYDAAGNRIRTSGTLARTGMPAPVTSATYDIANRLISRNGISYSYDNNGNLISDGARTYNWDDRDRLIGIAGATTASFGYDAYNRRRSKTVAGITTRYLYDGLNPVQEKTVDGTPSADILAGFGLDQYFRRTDASGAHDFITDALGSVLALSNASGALATEYTYAPYGETQVTGAANGNTLQYTGRENDGTGLYYYRARYYAPSMGRFITEDPIGLAAGPNTYVYVLNNPLRYIDPTGLSAYGFPWVPGPGYNPSPTYPDQYPENGNARPGFEPQNPGCDSFPDRLENKCVKKCCEEHDKCYAMFGCNASSWIGGSPSGPCKACNAAAKECVLKGLRSCDDCNQ